MQIDGISVHLLLLSLPLCVAAYLLYTFLFRSQRPDVQRLSNELLSLWLTWDGCIHGLFIALATISPPTAATTSRIAIIWQQFTLPLPSGKFQPADVIAQMAVLFVMPIGISAVMRWHREGKRWREGEMVVAAMEIYATILGFIRFRPERLRDMSPERREAALTTWAAFFFLNILWVVIPAVLLWWNFRVLSIESNEPQEQHAYEKAEHDQNTISMEAEFEEQ
ncbi:hypothetical protein DACRYDRAFT_20733 [Dacryopinax primogenitus]|uniref:EXPERA domain-containing protein n=1 Tax=Dacryopinax primogenitus (strain DJM 731) TaxID=1858805 RepID=M5G5T0_DACPD|nr:uncharacterized protein DACRYDRAFT_20733 [Dacryopinax primogenitus]EJU04074.1 hypothetical protein DACRYDRAFT_20733 [Dacryopinax primogenitus]